MNNKPCMDIPMFVSVEEQIERPIYVLPYLSEYWAEKKILFYKSSGRSNDRQEETGETWFPFYGIINDNNRDFFEEQGVKKEVVLESGVNTNNYSNGYFIKLSIIHQIKNKMIQETNNLFAKKYFIKEVNDFIKQFIDSLQKDEDFKEFDNGFIIRLNDYFTEINQMVISIWLNEKANLWKNRPRFVDFVKQQPYYIQLSNFSLCPYEENVLNKHDDEAMLAFFKNNGFPSNYPIDNIKKVFENSGNFVEQSDSIKYKQGAVIKLRTKRVISNNMKRIQEITNENTDTITTNIKQNKKQKQMSKESPAKIKSVKKKQKKIGGAKKTKKRQKK